MKIFCSENCFNVVNVADWRGGILRVGNLWYTPSPNFLVFWYVAPIYVYMVWVEYLGTISSSFADIGFSIFGQNWKMRISATLKRDYSNQQLVPKHIFKNSGSMHPTN